MTELVHNNRIGEMWRDVNESVIEIKVAFARTTPPARTLIAYRDFIVCEIVMLIEMRESFMYKFSCCFFVELVSFCRASKISSFYPPYTYDDARNKYAR